MKKIIILAIVMILLATSVFAIGISPARTTVNYEPDTKQDIKISVINNEHKDIKVKVYVEGKKELVKVTGETLNLKADEASRDIEVKLTMPESLTPGIHDIDIVIKQLLDEEYPSPMFIQTELAVISQIRILVPYPRKYVDVSAIEITNAIINSTASFKIPVINFGSEKINELSAKIKIMGPNNENIAEIFTQKESLEPKRRVLLEAKLNTKTLRPGKYYARAYVYYDENVTAAEKEFSLGKLIVKVLRISENAYQLGGIGKLDIWLESEWNEKIEGLFGEITARDSSKAAVASIKTASIDVPPYTPTVLTAFWDTQGLQVGEYFLNLRLKYNGIDQEEELISDIGYDSLKTRLAGMTGEAISEIKEKPSLVPIVIALIIVINILVFVIIRNKYKKGSPPKE